MNCLSPNLPASEGSALASATILVVDDEPDIREVIEEYLDARGYVAVGAADAAEARAIVEQRPVDLAIVDLSMPREDGLSLTRFLRERYPDLAIVILTSLGSVVDRVVGLEVGADDYLTKPFDPRELVARVRSVLRRTHARVRGEIGADRVRVGRCVLDLASRRLTDGDGTQVPLTPLEFDLLKAMVQNPNRVLSRERILNLSHGRDYGPFDRSVDLRVMRLRRKIEPDADHPRFIRTVRHEGYLFVPDAD